MLLLTSTFTISSWSGGGRRRGAVKKMKITEANTDGKGSQRESIPVFLFLFIKRA